MATQVQNRRGSTAEHSTFTGAVAEVTVDTDKDTVVVHDGATAGGRPLLREDGSNSALALGSAATPSLKFTGDANTGIYSPGADQLALSTNGTGRLFVDASGNIGVSQSSPGTKLHVAGGNISILQSGGGAYISSRRCLGTVESPTVINAADVELGGTFYSGWDGSSYSLGAQVVVGSTAAFSVGSTPAYYAIKTTPSGSASPLERLRITSAGLVGIGTSAPYSRLTVVPSAPTPTTPAAANQITIGESSQNSGYRLQLGYLFDTLGRGSIQSYDNNNPGTLILNGAGGNVGIGDTAPGSTLTVKGATGVTPLQISGPSSEFCRVDTSGRLLVGTSSSPSAGNGQYAKLLVQGNTSGPGAGIFNIQRTVASASVVSDDDIGFLQFTGNDGNVFASIRAAADGTTGSNDYPGRLTFSTTADGASSPTERMRIGNSGQTDVYATTATVLGLRTNLTAGTSAMMIGYNNASSTQNGTIVVVIRADGDLENANNSYGAYSDEKLKENIVGAGSQWSDIKSLTVRKFNFKEDTGFSTHTQIGLIAQEVELVSPGLVTESPDRDAEGNDLGTTTKSVNYSVLYMKAVKALQEAMERIETLEAKVAALENA